MMSTTRVSLAVPTGLRVRLADVLAGLGRFPLPVLQLLFRLAVGSVFLKAGMTKIASWPFTVQLFQDEYQVPVLPAETAALLATTFELGCSALLIAGLGTRLATLPLFGMIAVIQLFVYPNAWSEHLVWGSILAFLLTRGPGPLSVDRLVGLDGRHREG
jgi:putative oxidoreductase